MWERSAEAWIAAQGNEGDRSRRTILDPALVPILGDVKGKHVLDIGCGEGRYARKLTEKGAKVTALDPTPTLLHHARKRTPGINLIRASGESLSLQDDAFDITLSYLSLVDVPDDEAACREMIRVTKPKGKIVIVTVSNVASTSDGWERDEERRAVRRTVDRYMESFAMTVAWKGIEIINYHRPLSRTLGHFLKNGCVLTEFLEPLPEPGTTAYEEEMRVPTFQILVFRRLAPEN